MVIINAHGNASVCANLEAIRSRLQGFLTKGGVQTGVVRITIVEADPVLLERNEGVTDDFGENSCLVIVPTPEGEQPYICKLIPQYEISEKDISEALRACFSNQSTSNGEHVGSDIEDLSWTQLRSDADMLARVLKAFNDEQAVPRVQRRRASLIIKETLRLRSSLVRIGELVRTMTRDGLIEKTGEHNDPDGKVSDYEVTTQGQVIVCNNNTDQKK